MFDTDNSIIVELNDENAKCKRIVFQTEDETLIRAAMLKLGFPFGTFNLRKQKVNISSPKQSGPRAATD